MAEKTQRDNGCEDSSFEKAFETYKKFIEEHPEVKQKGLSDYLKEDPTLLTKISYEELKENNLI